MQLSMEISTVWAGGGREGVQEVARLLRFLNLPTACVLQDLFFEKHGVKLGFMSAFVKASAYALQEVPAVNAGEGRC